MQQVFQQVRGSAIGNQISPILADIAVSYVEEQWWTQNEHLIDPSVTTFSFADMLTIGWLYFLKPLHIAHGCDAFDPAAALLGAKPLPPIVVCKPVATNAGPFHGLRLGITLGVWRAGRGSGDRKSLSGKGAVDMNLAKVVHVLLLTPVQVEQAPYCFQASILGCSPMCVTPVPSPCRLPV